MNKIEPYTPMNGWFNLLNLNLPREKFSAYAKLQKRGEHYQRTYAYQKQHNRVQLDKLKELCAEMSLDLILNYGALEQEDAQ